MLKIYFIRHGETYFNHFGRMQGWSDTPLTPKGIEDVRTTSETLKHIDFDVVVTSDLRRTIETRDIIVASEGFKKGIKTIIEPKLRETFFGGLEGEISDVVYQSVADLYNVTKEEVFTKLSFRELSNAMAAQDAYGLAETYEVCSKRLITWLSEFINEHNELDKEKHVCVITHGNVIRNLVHYVEPTLHVTKNIQNSSITILNCESDTKISVEKFD